MTTTSDIIVSDLDSSTRILFECMKFWGASLMIHWLANLIKGGEKCKHTAVSDKYCNETPFVPWHAAMFMKTSQLSCFRAPVGAAWGGWMFGWLTDSGHGQHKHTWQHSESTEPRASLHVTHTHTQLILQTGKSVLLTLAVQPGNIVTVCMWFSGFMEARTVENCPHS